MKHKYLLSGILLAGLMLLSGCENNFDAKIYGELSTTNFHRLLLTMKAI